MWDTEVVKMCWDFTDCGCGDGMGLRGSQMSIIPSGLRISYSYVVMYLTWTWGLLTCVLPVLVLTVLNSRVYLAMQQMKQRMELKRRRSETGTHATILRRTQHKIDLNLSLILLVTIILFFMFHTPRVIISIYEAFTIQKVVNCSQNGLGYYHIWYLYAQSVAQFLQVTRCSQNFPIYMWLNTAFRNIVFEWKNECFKFARSIYRKGESVPPEEGSIEIMALHPVQFKELEQVHVHGEDLEMSPTL
eukprot:GFUD01119133.1.p1 GENE.GFUD01119133.1~~GFUD01119133.1.p1  ORF type:complete len:246 (-),score=49.89 GFUD01119133.1:20-757(-)